MNNETNNKNKKQIIVSVSGGKDSTALYLYALEEGIDFKAVFADTGHEHEWTIDYVNSLHEKTGGPKVKTVRQDFPEEMFEERRERIKKDWPGKFGKSQEKCDEVASNLKRTGNPFLDMCLLKSCFPNSKYRFCTEKLKINPIEKQIYLPLISKGFEIECWQGIRAEESKKRALMEKRSIVERGEVRYKVYRPMLDWTVDQVFEMHSRHGIQANPLYKWGCKRVGCFPCIYSRKSDLKVLGKWFLDHVDRIREWERLVGQVSPNYASKLLSHGYDENKMGIDNMVEWAKTDRGGGQYLFDDDGFCDVNNPVTLSCSEFGVCE